MTNGEKFRNPDERGKGFAAYCHKQECRNCELTKFNKLHESYCSFYWLELEYKDALKPCPFCGGEARIVTRAGGGTDYYFVECKTCFGKSVSYLKQEDAIAAWNRRTYEQK